MKVRDIKNYLVLFLILVYTVIYKLVIFTNFKGYGDTITACFLIVLVSVMVVLFGFQKDKFNNIKKIIFKNTLFYVLVTFAVIYALGFYTGFVNNAYSLRPDKILENIFAPIFIILCIEFIRYIIVSSNRDNNTPLIVMTIVMIIFEMVTQLKPITDFSPRNIFEILTSSVLPIIFKQGMLTYLCKQAGLRSTLIYRIIMDLYFYLLPIFPNLGKYLDSMILISLPIIIYLSTVSIVDEYNNGVTHNFDNNFFKAYDIPLIVLIAVFAMLVSGFFEFQMIGIGSESMTPKINKGDAVIMKRVHSKKDLRVGEVIAYRNEGKIVVHRLYKIKKSKGKVYYVTKGDANRSPDNVKIDIKNIKGVVKVKIPYIAYPSVFLSELFHER